MKKSALKSGKSSDGLNREPKTIRSSVSYHRSEPSIAPTLHPWYYVKGRPDLTEQRISGRRERDNQMHRQSVSNDQYFSRTAAENQVYRKWSDDKSLVKHRKAGDAVTKPPFDTFSDDNKSGDKSRQYLRIRSNKEAEKKYLSSKAKLKEFMDSFNSMDERMDGLERRQDIIVFQLNELKKIRTRFAEKRELFDLKDKQLVLQRFGHLKLRMKCFDIVDHLRYHNMCVECIRNLPDFETILNADELVQLREVMDRAVKIIDMYIDVNNNRNNEFQLLYDEEADTRWETQENEWYIEYEVWNVMTEKLMDSYKSILKDKLNQVLTQVTDALAVREQSVKELTSFTTKFKTDPNLSALLTENVYDLMSEGIANGVEK